MPLDIKAGFNLIEDSEGMPKNATANIAGTTGGSITIAPDEGKVFLASKIETTLGADCTVKEVKIDGVELNVKNNLDDIDVYALNGQIHQIVRDKIEIVIANSGQAVDCSALVRGLHSDLID